MKIIGNIIWWIFGGLETAIGYMTAGLVLCLTIVGIPFGFQLFKIAAVMVFPLRKQGERVNRRAGEYDSQYPLVYPRRYLDRPHALSLRDTPLHHDHRDPLRETALQICRHSTSPLRA